MISMKCVVLENLDRYLIIQIVLQKTEYIACLELSGLVEDILLSVFIILGIVFLVAGAFESKQADLFDFIEWETAIGFFIYHS